MVRRPLQSKQPAENAPENKSGAIPGISQAIIHQPQTRPPRSFSQTAPISPSLSPKNISCQPDRYA